MKHLFLYMFLVLFFLMNLGLMFKINTIKKESLLSMKNQLENFNQYLELYYDQLFQEQLNNGTKIIHTIEVQDELKNKSSLGELFDASPKIVLRFSELGCNACIEEELAIIKEYALKIGNKNILILTNYTNSRKILNFKTKNNIDFEVLSCDNLGLPFEKENRLYTFILDSTFMVNNFFIPEKTLPKLSKNYYTAIIQKYFLDSTIDSINMDNIFTKNDLSK